MEWLLDHQARRGRGCVLCGFELFDDVFMLAPDPGELSHGLRHSK